MVIVKKEIFKTLCHFVVNFLAKLKVHFQNGHCCECVLILSLTLVSLKEAYNF